MDGLDLLVGLVNTRHVPDEDDVLADAARAQRWAGAVLGRPVRMDETSRRRLADLREGLRNWVRHRQAVAYGPGSPTRDEVPSAGLDPGPDPDALAATSARAERVLAGTPLVLAAADGTPPRRLRPAAAAPDAGDELVAGVAAALLAAQTTGAWTRLKTCADPACQWAFVDTSKNRTRRWHSMTQCGNRAKNRLYRARAAAPQTA